jgi:hypothetical protein
MLLTKFTCPHCEAVLNHLKGIEAGKRIRCPKCQEPFAVRSGGGEEDEERVQARPSAARVGKKVKRTRQADEDERDEDVEDQEREEPPRKKKRKKGKKQEKNASNLLPLLILGGCVLIAGVATGLYFLLHKKSGETSAPPTPVVSGGPQLPPNGLVPFKPGQTGNIKIELLEPRADVFLEMAGDKILFFIDAKIKYRFPDGVPSTSGTLIVWAKCDEGNGMITLGPAFNLKAEGEAHTTMLLRKATADPEVLAPNGFSGVSREQSAATL